MGEEEKEENMYLMGKYTFNQRKLFHVARK